MLNPDQREIVKRVYAKFAESDTAGNQGWSEIDENMSWLGSLPDYQVVIEAAAKVTEQKTGNPRCNMDHPNSECFVPTVVEAIDILIDLYSSTGHLPAKNRFVLEYYLTLSFVGYIIS